MVYAIEMVPSGWVTLVDPQQEELHGMPCIKGRWVTGNPDNWAHNRTVYVPVSHIKTVSVFGSPDEYFEAGKKSRLSDFPRSDPAGQRNT